ncbi:hypothetical protein N7478_010546 [Penicillium angulare]|uniref:uncharacterized protein n=1 Tax=Penicillium angulare TaxID=116970 RepID=UPI0025403727|nr:uncharacterized protein N7478_010546 [Penicillium angulare]KAJ5267738.1 hypothetical protein N7478_010546 [Penicillium angulare]
MIPGLTLCFRGSMCGVLETRTLVSHADFWPGFSEVSKDWVLQNWHPNVFRTSNRAFVLDLQIPPNESHPELMLDMSPNQYHFTEALFRSLLVDKVPPLFRAVAAQRLDIAARFIEEYHLNIDSEYAGKNVLLLAIDLQYPEAVGLILEYQPNLRYSYDFGGRGPLSLAVIDENAAIVERLLQYQEIDVNDRCSDGHSAMVYAVNRREYYILNLLLDDCRAHVNITDHLGWTPLHYAIFEKNHIAVEMLATHAGINVHRQSSQHDPPLVLAPGVCINAQTTQVVPPLWFASRAGNTPAVEALLRLESVKVNQKSPTGTTPLQVAVVFYKLPVVFALLRQENRIYINARGRQQGTAVFFAASTGCVSRIHSPGFTEEAEVLFGTGFVKQRYRIDLLVSS